MVRESAGKIISVAAGEILAAQQLLRDLEGLEVCPAAAAALAGLIRQRRTGQIGPDETVLVNLTGATRAGTPPTPETRWIYRAKTGDGTSVRSTTPGNVIFEVQCERSARHRPEGHHARLALDRGRPRATVGQSSKRTCESGAPVSVR